MVLPSLSSSEIIVSGDTVTLTLRTQPGKTYRLEYKSDLSKTNWTAVEGDLLTTADTLSFTNLPASDRQRYYRAFQLD